MAGTQASFKDKVVKGFLWVGTGTFLGQVVSWLSTLLVIRLLSPSDYGLMAMALTFTGLLTMISGLGVNAPVIQAADISDRQIQQLFGFVVLTGAASWLVCHLTAPLIARFYGEKDLILMIRVMNINFILIAFYLIPQSLLVREMDFKTKAKVDVLAQVGSALLTLSLAWKGLGAWSLIVGLISMHAIKAVGFTVARSSWIKPLFFFKGVGDFLKFGLVVTGDGLLFYVFNMSDKIIVGKFLADRVLGIYSVALNLASIPAEKVLPIITQVSFTSYSRIQNDGERINRNLLRATRIIAFVGFPLFLGMAALAQEGIPLILGSKWTSAVVPFQLLCFVLPLKSLSPILPPAVIAIGKPRVNLTNMAISSFLITVALLIGVRYGLVGVCMAWIIGFPVIFAITSVRCLRVLNLPIKDFLAEIYFPFLASTFMLAFLYLLKNVLVLQPIFSLVLQVFSGVILYLSLTLLFRKREFSELQSLIRR